MSKKNVEIVSFNDLVPELPTLLELDDMDLELVNGGLAPIEDEPCGTNCGTNCGVYI